MLALDQPIQLNLVAGEVQAVLAGLAELPYKMSAQAIDKIKAQVLAIDPEAFGAAQQSAQPELPLSNGELHAQRDRETLLQR